MNLRLLTCSSRTSSDPAAAAFYADLKRQLDAPLPTRPLTLPPSDYSISCHPPMPPFAGFELSQSERIALALGGGALASTATVVGAAYVGPPIIAGLTWAGVPPIAMAITGAAATGTDYGILIADTIVNMQHGNWENVAFNIGLGASTAGAGLPIRPKPTTDLKGNVVIKEGKWDYFYSTVKSSPHNEARSLQNLNDLRTLGFPDTEAGRAGLTRLFEIGRYLPEASRHTTQYGITITRSIPIGNGGTIDVKYFYPGGDLNAVPEISTIIPKVFR